MLSNMDHHRIYKDLPLNENAFSTRLLTILPGSGDDPLVCRLRSADINAYATYDALSYTWGDHNDKRMILVNAEPFSVTTNLEDALRALRLSDRPRELWVDAICINQADLQEKAAQIPEMGHIYRNAHRVVIWLGKRNEYTDYAINVAKADTTAMHLRWSVKTKQYEDDPQLDLQSSKQGEAFAKGLEDLLLRPWWTRVWVVQEVAMAYSDPLITCGNASVPWRSFVKCIANYERFSSLSINDGCGLPRRKNNYQLRQCYHVKEINTMRLRVRRPPSLRHRSVIRDDLTLVEDDFYWISKTWRFNSHDPRDRLYALLGLTRSPFGKSINIDYNVPVPDLMKRIMHAEVETYQRLDLLVLCDPDKCSTSPSWLPDLDAPGAAGLPAVRQALSGEDPFSRYIKATQRDTEKIINDPRCSLDWRSGLLRSTGACVGTVMSMQDCTSDVGKTLECNQHSREAKWETCVSRLRQRVYSDLEHLFQQAAPKLSISQIKALDVALKDLDASSGWRWEEETGAAKHFDQSSRWLEEEARAATVHFYWEPLWTRLRINARQIVLYDFNEDEEEEEELAILDQPVTMSLEEQYRVQSAAANIPISESSAADKERVWFTTDTGLIGLGPSGIKANDEVVMFHASPFAFVLRAKDSKHRLIGQALVCPPRQIPPPYEIPGVDHPMDYPRRWREPILRTFVLE